MSVDELIIAAVGLVSLVCTLIVIVGSILIDRVLIPRHRERTGRDLIEPPMPLPFLSALYAGMDVIAPRLNRSPATVTIDKAPRAWRRLTVAVAVAVWLGIASLIVGLLLIPEGYG